MTTQLALAVPVLAVALIAADRIHQAGAAGGLLEDAARLDGRRQEYEERDRYTRTVLTELVAGRAALPDAAGTLGRIRAADTSYQAVTRSRYPGLPSAAADARMLVGRVELELADDPRRADVLGRLEAEYRSAFGPPPGESAVEPLAAGRRNPDNDGDEFAAAGDAACCPPSCSASAPGAGPAARPRTWGRSRSGAAGAGWCSSSTRRWPPPPGCSGPTGGPCSFGERRSRPAGS